MKGYIYLIVNIINGKLYVGKTLYSLEDRFKIHKKDAKRDRCKHRPLYRAMNKYGFENFKISPLGQFDKTFIK